MNQKLVLGAVVLVIAAVAIALLGKNTSTQVETPGNTSLVENENGEVMVNDEKSLPSNTTRYVEFSDGVIGQYANTRRVLYFYANWCPTCKPADASFKQNSSQIPQDVVVIRVNYNDTDTDQREKDLAKKYGITYQHTFVQIDESDKEVTKWNGGALSELIANIK